MADYTMQRKGARLFAISQMAVPNNGGSKTVELVAVPEDLLGTNPIPPLFAVQGWNQHATQWYTTNASWDPATFTYTVTFVNTTPGAGQDGLWDIAVWFPHSKVR